MASHVGSSFFESYPPYEGQYLSDHIRVMEEMPNDVSLP